MKSLEELRARLDVIDRDLLQLVAERQTLGKQIAEVKRSAGQPTRDFRREREVLLQARRDAEALGVSPALAESLLQSLIRGSLTTQEQARVACAGPGLGTQRAGHRRQRQDGSLGSGFSRGAGLRGHGGRSVGRGGRVRLRRRLEDDRPASRLHRRGHADPDRERSAGGTGRAAAARHRVRHRFAEDAAALGTRAAPCRRVSRDVGAPDVRSGHRAAVGPARDLHRPRRRGGARGSARPVRFDDGRSRRDGTRRARPSHCFRARSLACAEHRVFHGAGRERRSRATARAHVEHDVRRAARRRDPRRGREPRPVFRDPEPERLRRGIAERLAGCGRSPVPLGSRG